MDAAAFYHLGFGRRLCGSDRIFVERFRPAAVALSHRRISDKPNSENRGKRHD